MNTRLVVLALSLLAAPRARASADRPYPLYDVDAAKLEPSAKAAVEEASRVCTVSTMSRMGPSPGAVAACNAATGKAIALGTPAAYAALAALDTGDPTARAIASLYDIVGRSGDLALVEPLIRALEREDKQGLGNPRQFERNLIADALAALTYTELRGTPAVQWRAWSNEHPNPSRATLRTARLAAVEVQIATGRVEEIVEAARFLATQPGGATRARVLLDGAESQPGLTHTQQSLVRQARWRLPPEAQPQLQPQAKTAKHLPST